MKVTTIKNGLTDLENIDFATPDVKEEYKAMLQSYTSLQEKNEELKKAIEVATGGNYEVKNLFEIDDYFVIEHRYHSIVFFDVISDRYEEFGDGYLTLEGALIAIVAHRAGCSQQVVPYIGKLLDLSDI